MPYPKLTAYLPNALTVSRFIAGVAFPFVPRNLWLPLIVYAGLTDLIDGEIGRRTGSVSRFGQIADPIADKTFVLSCLGTLLLKRYAMWWEVLLLATRDLAVLTIALLVVIRGWRLVTRMKPRFAGKVATGGQFVWLVSIIACAHCATYTFLPAVVLSVIAAVDYTVVAMKASEDPGRN